MIMKLKDAFLPVGFILLALSGYLSATPLDDYVNTPDSHYKYELIKSYVMPGYKLFVLNMTSQKWLGKIN